MGLTDPVAQPVELMVRLVEGVPLRHCVTVLVPVNEPEGVLEPVGQELWVGVALEQWEIEGDVVPVLDPEGLTLGLVVGVTLLHCVVVLEPVKEPLAEREADTVTDCVWEPLGL